MDRKRVVVGMSGGVDSSVCAALLKEAGYEVIGVTIKTLPDMGNHAIEDAARIAGQLKIEHHLVDAHEAFFGEVIEPFEMEYLSGRTPNPCVLCNPKVKWGALLSAAGEVGADYVATGHYARVAGLPNGRFTIRRAASGKKDQSYALYALSQEQLAHTLLPLGEYEKPHVREIAGDLGLAVAEKPDSQDICFISDHDYARYIKDNVKEPSPEGNFVTADGRILGRHRGIIHYTIGQRKGLGLSMGHPVFVTAIRPETNEVVIGEEEDLYKRSLLCSGLHFMSISELNGEIPVMAKIRYNHKGAKAVLRPAGEDLAEVVFEDPVRAVTPGQAAVFYDGDCIVGGGSICG